MQETTTKPAHSNDGVDSALKGVVRALGLTIFWASLLGLVLRVAVGPELFDFSSPLTYALDGISHSFVIKTLIDEGWFPAYNRFVGAPFVGTYFDYPGSDAANYLLIRLIAVFAQDWAVVQNVYFLVGFVLSAISAHLVLRYVGVSSLFAVVGALLFSLLPFHFLRTQHPFLASYFCVPVAIWLVLEAWRLGSVWRGWRTVGARRWGCLAAGAILVAASGIYYAFFTMALVLAGGLAAWTGARSWRASLPACVVALAVALTVSASVLPSEFYWRQEGPNPEAVRRQPNESEIYGLTLTQLLFPRPMHRWEPARAFSARYHYETPPNFEKRASALGVVASAGLLYLAWVAFCRLVTRRRDDVTTIDRLAMLAAVAFLIGTIGGFGAIFAWLVSPMIRAYARISVFLGFISLAGAMLALQGWLYRVVRRHAVAGYVAAALALAVGIVGVLDQTSPGEFARADSKAQFESDRAFVRRAEQVLPPGAAIYQLPYHRFPEAGPQNRMADYDLFRGYLHSKSLHWSYGNIKGRGEDLWQRTLSARSIPAQVDVATASGFAAVYVERRAYADQGEAVEASLRQMLGAPMLVSGDRNLAMYDLRAARGRGPGAEDAVAPFGNPVDLRVKELSQLALAGFGGAEPWGRWTAGPMAKLVFLRPLPPHFAIELEIVGAFGRNFGAVIRARVGNAAQSFTADRLPRLVRLEFNLPKPEHTLELAIPHPTSPASVGPSEDDRLLGIGISSVRIVPLD